MIKAIRSKERRSFSKIERDWDIQIPNLLDVQLESFRNFLQTDLEPLKRKNEGLQEVFNSVFPISDAREYFSLEFVRYDLGEPKYSVDECQERDLTYSVPLKATLRLRVREDTEEGHKDKSIIELPVYDGSEKGEKVYNTLTVIGRVIAPNERVPTDAAAGKEALAGLKRWPVTVSYFERDAASSDQVPVYAIKFELYENGISRALVLDYNDFAISGELTSLEIRESKPCN